MNSTERDLPEDKLREIIAGCEGVTPGPWQVRGDPSHYDSATDIYAQGFIIAQICGKSFEGMEARAAHIARLDPATVSAMASELLRARDALASIRAERDAAVAASVADIVAERERQKSVEGWTVEHDDRHVDGELGRAGAAYALFAASPKRFTALARAMRDMIPSVWPWDAGWWKPSDQNRRNLVKAGALILAEIDRLDRARAIAGEQTNDA